MSAPMMLTIACWLGLGLQVGPLRAHVAARDLHDFRGFVFRPGEQQII